MKKLPKRILQKIEALPDAIVAGEFIPKVGDKILVRRDHRLEPVTTVLRIIKITPNTERGTLVETVDEMMSQMFAFETKDAERFTAKMLTLPSDPVPAEEVDDGITVNDKAH